MPVVRREQIEVGAERDLLQVRKIVREAVSELGYDSFAQTKLLTASSELARNALIHGGGGSVVVEWLEDGLRRGLRLIIEDQGPGMADVDEALRDGFTTGRGLGLGLGGARRLMDQLHIDSALGRGTRIEATRWVNAHAGSARRR